MRRAALALALLLALVLVAACGGDSSKKDEEKGSAGAPAQQPRREIFLGVSPGLPLLGSPKLLQREVPVMAQVGVTSLRTPFYWSNLEPQRGKPRLARTDAVVAAAARARLDVLPVVQGAPAWAKANPYDSAGPPRDPDDYARFLTTLIERYGPEGSLWRERPELPKMPIRAWQIWNEPSHDYYWSTQPWAPSYVRVLKVAHKAIRKADPGAKTVLAGFPDRSWESLRAVLDAGASGSFDVAAAHPYTAKVSNVLKIVELDRAALRAGGDGKTPLWLTELAWSSGQGKVGPRYAFGFETTEQGQAARLSQGLSLLASKRKALGIERMYWETWSSRGRNAKSTWDWAGLREIRGEQVRPKPAFNAFVRVAKQVGQG